MVVRLNKEIKLDEFVNVFHGKPKFYGFAVLQAVESTEGSNWIVRWLSTSKQDLTLDPFNMFEIPCQIVSFTEHGERIYTIESTTVISSSSY